MAQKQEEKVDSTSPFAAYNEEITKLQRQLKGAKGQNVRLMKELAAIQGKQVDSSHSESDSSASESVQVPPSHLAREYEKVCVDCGGDNPNFKGAPNVFCNGPDCKGRIPMGHIEKEAIVKKEGGVVDLPGVGKCFNCGRDDQAVVELA